MPTQSAGPIATTTDAAVVGIAKADMGGLTARHISVINEGADPGFFSLDGGTTLRRIPGNTGRQMDGVSLQDDIVIQRPAGGSNMADVYIDIW